MSESVTPQYLLEGAVYALEQGGLLLRDAFVLYRSGSPATAVVLAAFAREEVGRWKLLLSLRKEALGGKTVTVNDIKTRCKNHVRNQKAGMLSLTLRADRDSVEGKLVLSTMTALPGSEEWKAAVDALKEIDRAQEQRVPLERHAQRKSALYVDAVSQDRWNRPSTDISQAFAQDFLCDARNDYRVQALNRYGDLEILKHIDAELSDALEQWSDRPQLPEPEGPM